jgi:transposase-like protein
MKERNRFKGRKGQKGRLGYDEPFRRRVAFDYLNGDRSLWQLAAIYNVPAQTICRWSMRFSGELTEQIPQTPMTEEEQKQVEVLKKQVEELKKKLEYEQMRNFALETMADLAKSKLGIDIRKNFGAKQPKR